MSLKLGIIGAGGRMGRALCELLPNFPDFELVAAIERKDGDLIGQLVPIGNTKSKQITYSDSIKEAVLAADIIIDFSTPESTRNLLAELKLNPKPVLVCTTGLSSEVVAEMKEVAEVAPVSLASNTSLGVFLLRHLAVSAAKILGSDFDIEVVESHHRNKKDAPSGTALSLVADLQSVRSMEVAVDRTPRKVARSSNEIGISCLRGGDIVGEHTVYFLGQGERLEITHKASDRTLFARGAFNLAKLLGHKPPGFYNPADLFRLFI